jgi:hypothetical protein
MAKKRKYRTKADAEFARRDDIKRAKEREEREKEIEKERERKDAFPMFSVCRIPRSSGWFWAAWKKAAEFTGSQSMPAKYGITGSESPRVAHLCAIENSSMNKTIIAFTVTLLLTPLSAGSNAALLCAGSSFAGDGGAASNNLIVYPPVPGLSSSDHYAVRVRPARADAPWQSAFVFKTACKDFGRFDPKNRGKIDTEGYCAHLSGWSHSYVNFETAGPVEVEIAKVDGTAIRKATVHPVRYGKNVHLKEGKAFLTLEHSCLVAMDIDGEMCDQDTTRTPGGGWYTGPPLHAISIFANPIFSNKPRLGDPTVYAVKPGEKLPTDGNWKTLYFLPGVHDIGLAYPLHASKNYYIPGDAVVHGTFHQENNADGGHDIRIFGCGTLSGERLPSAWARKLPAQKSYEHCPIWIQSPYNAKIEGITIADPAF